MSTPLFVISTFKVHEGKLDDLQKYYKKILKIVQVNEPQLIAFQGFLNEDGTEMTSIQVHPDSDSMEFHMQVLKDNWNDSFNEYSQILQGVRVEYFGLPPKSALEMKLQPGTKLHQKPQHIGGFINSTTD